MIQRDTRDGAKPVEQIVVRLVLQAGRCVGTPRGGGPFVADQVDDHEVIAAERGDSLAGPAGGVADFVVACPVLHRLEHV